MRSDNLLRRERLLHPLTAVSLALVILAAFVPIFGDRLMMNIAIMAMIYIILGHSWNLLTGLAGMFSITHALFFGLGVYGMSISVAKFHLPIIAGLLVGLLINIVMSAIVGMIGSKLSGLYFVMAQVGLSQTIYTLSIQLFPLTGGVTGLSMPREYLMDKSTLYWIALILAILTTLAFAFIRRSRMGTMFVALKENPDLSLSLGSNVGKWRIMATVMSASMASLAGSFYALFMMSNNPEVFSMVISLKIIIVVIVGGIGSVWGPIVGSSLVVMDELIRGIMPTTMAPFSVIIYALVLIIMAIRHPEGLISIGRSIGLKLEGKSMKKVSISK
ncbi:branched-chain amino acid ABC transporter permease [Neobacillus sp. 114]|uniref:branched-chain amino acid ABC transporter permease n=1 Tax=Neobacillus sp. 114 TaxID=3048535 RepID=UPI001C220531|nr:branched-chain amino acid ABC transporter permease [Neobacillus sp. 114]MBU8915151.1 branched-chain amino acid ABC transporter permease [Bacillus sp. FJAT-29953]